MKLIITTLLALIAIGVSAQTNITTKPFQIGRQRILLPCVTNYWANWEAKFTNTVHWVKGTNLIATTTCDTNHCVVQATDSVFSYAGGCGTNTVSWSTFVPYTTNYNLTVYGQDPVPTNPVTLHLNSAFGG